jgi:predicted DNA-binding protein with PD1-like motif
MEGNISTIDGKPMYHLHTALGSMLEENFGETIGAHFLNADTAVVCEFFITAYDQKVERVLDEETNLKL